MKKTEFWRVFFKSSLTRLLLLTILVGFQSRQSKADLPKYNRSNESIYFLSSRGLDIDSMFFSLDIGNYYFNPARVSTNRQNNFSLGLQQMSGGDESNDFWEKTGYFLSLSMPNLSIFNTQQNNLIDDHPDNYSKRHLGLQLGVSSRDLNLTHRYNVALGFTAHKLTNHNSDFKIDDLFTWDAGLLFDFNNIVLDLVVLDLSQVYFSRDDANKLNYKTNYALGLSGKPFLDILLSFKVQSRADDPELDLRIRFGWYKYFPSRRVGVAADFCLDIDYDNTYTNIPLSRTSLGLFYSFESSVKRLKRQKKNMMWLSDNLKLRFGLALQRSNFAPPLEVRSVKRVDFNSQIQFYVGLSKDF